MLSVKEMIKTALGFFIAYIFLYVIAAGFM